MKIRLSQRASEQLFSAFEYLQTDSARVAVSQMKRIFEAIDLLERYPMAGRKGRIEGTREMVIPRTPFIVAYSIAGNEIHILAVLHGAQRWPESL